MDSVAPLLDGGGLDAIAFSTEQAAEERSPVMAQEHPVLIVSVLIINKHSILLLQFGE